MKVMTIFTSVGSEDEANLIAKVIVDKKLAACAQISAINSFYHWDGSVQNEKEFRILFKTDAKNYTIIEKIIQEMHSYDLPAIHGVLIDEISVPYKQWILENSSFNPQFSE